MPKKISYLKLIWQQFWRFHLNRLGFGCVLLMFLVAWFAPLLASNSPYYLVTNGKTYFPILTEIVPFKFFVSYPEWQGTNFRKMVLKQGDQRVMPPVPFSSTEYDLDVPLIPPSSPHYFGTDEQGRDVLSRLIYGARTSLSVGFVAVGIYVLIGILVGAFAGYYGGTFDLIVSRLIEMIMCFPTFFLILAVLAFIGPSLYNIMIVIGLTSWTGIARLVRGEFLKLRAQEFVASIQAAGASPGRIIFRHLLPNAMAPVMVSASFGIASAILIESSLSFLGFGVQPPTPSWGDILSQSREFMDIAWWLTFFPGLAIFVTITAFNLVGEGLRDAVDPRLRR